MIALSIYTCSRFNLNDYLFCLLFILSLFIPLPTQAATDCTAVTQIPQPECEALLDLYEQTNGSNWKENSGWGKNNELCAWYGIWCDNNRVFAISLNNNQLDGSIPDSIGQLTQL
ncbi:MAG: hypothetical protein SVR94_10260, partial [Pseudomonadota bacterium]|nr:hypothetical protein [Pseudomonadota bacterium]